MGVAVPETKVAAVLAPAGFAEHGGVAAPLAQSDRELTGGSSLIEVADADLPDQLSSEHFATSGDKDKRKNLPAERFDLP
jgi:hypothetical protein